MSDYWKISDFSKEVGKHINTVDGWFKKLEEQGIHYINRANNEKVYDELDLKIGIFIKNKRDEKWALDGIFDVLEEHFELRPFPEHMETTKDSELLDIERLKRDLSSNIRSVFTEEIQGLKELIVDQQKEILELRKTVEEQKKLESPNDELISKISEQEQRAERRDDQLLSTIRELQKQRKLMNEVLEGQKQISTTQEKRGFFSRFFNK